MYDIIIIGAGPAGISAGIYAVSRGKKTLLIEKDKVGGLIGKVSTVTHYAGVIKGETGVTFAERLRWQAEHAGVEKVESLEISDEKTGSIETISDPGCGIFVYAGTTPNAELYTELHLNNGFIVVNENQETEIEGVYAAGDICEKQVRQVATAVSDGTIAAIRAAM